MGAHRIIDITVGNNAEDLVVYGNQLFVAVESGTQVIVIDTRTNSISGSIDIGDGPWWMALVETTTSAGVLDPKLCVVRGSDLLMTVVSLTESDTPTAYFPLDTYGGKQIFVAQLADTRRGGVYVLDQNNSRLLVVSAQTNILVEEIALGFIPWRMVVSSDGSRVYVTHPNDKLISVIDTTVTPPSVTTVQVAPYPFDVFISPSGGRLYMTHWISYVAGLFRVIDLTTMLASSINTDLEPMAIAGDDARAYVGCVGGKSIQILDTTTVPPQLLETIPIDGAPGVLAVSEDRETLYANDFTSDVVHAVTLAAS